MGKRYPCEGCGKFNCTCTRDNEMRCAKCGKVVHPEALLSHMCQTLPKQDELSTLRDQVARLTEERDRLCELLYGGRCVYCGEVVGADTQNQDLSDEVLREHIQNCPAHPYVQMRDRAEAAEKDRDRWKREHDDMLAISRDLIADLDTLRAENANLRAQAEAARELLGEALSLACCKDSDGDFLHGPLAIRINLYLNAKQSVPPRTYEQGAEEPIEMSAARVVGMCSARPSLNINSAIDVIRALRIEGE